MNYIKFEVSPDNIYFRVVTSEGVYVSHFEQYEGSYKKPVVGNKKEIYNYLIQADDKTIYEILERQCENALLVIITSDEPFHVNLIDDTTENTFARLNSSIDNWAEGERIKSAIKKFNKLKEEEEREQAERECNEFGILEAEFIKNIFNEEEK